MPFVTSVFDFLHFLPLGLLGALGVLLDCWDVAEVSFVYCLRLPPHMFWLHAFWYDLFRLDAICQFMVTQSVTIESPVQIRSHTSEYGLIRSSTGLS